MPIIDWPKLGVIEVPDGIDPKRIKNAAKRRLEASRSVPLQQAIPASAEIRAKTLSDRIRDARDQIGRIIAPFVGLDFEQMADDESKGILRQMLVYHGSPHVFERFEPAKIGTGEGAQAFGHGLYFAENPKIAQAYQSQVKDWTKIDEINKRLTVLARTVERERAMNYGTLRTKVGRDAMEEYKRLMSEKMAPGHLYQAELPDDVVPKMLDWDKPLSEQAQGIRDAITSIVQTDADAKGESVYQMLSSSLGSDQKASEFLASKGIPGIKYLDRLSRGTGQGTSNFVIFDPDILKDLKRSQ